MEKPQALIIDDDEMLANFFAAAFEDSGYDVYTVFDGQQAQQHLADQVPNVVVLDLKLPDITGEQLLSFLRGDARFKNTWIFATSVEATRVSFLQEKADLILTKPVTYQQVLHLAERVYSKVKSD